MVEITILATHRQFNPFKKVRLDFRTIRSLPLWKKVGKQVGRNKVLLRFQMIPSKEVISWVKKIAWVKTVNW